MASLFRGRGLERDVREESETTWPSGRGPGEGISTESARSALTCLESGVALADHEQLAASTHDLAIRVT